RGGKGLRRGGDDGVDLGVDFVVAEGAGGVAEAEAERERLFARADLLAAVGADEVDRFEEGGADRRGRRSVARGFDGVADGGPGDGVVEDEGEVAVDGREGGEGVGGGFGRVEGEERGEVEFGGGEGDGEGEGARGVGADE